MEVPKRRSLNEIDEAYWNNEDRLTLEKIVRAFKGIQDLHYLDKNSFYMLGGFHGEPFRGPGNDLKETLWWGGYCNHGNVLFPTWHRAYLVRFEKALQSIKGCEDVMIPFWDECLGADAKPGQLDITKVIPRCLTEPKFDLDGKTIDNPLYSYKLAKDTNFFRNSESDPGAEGKNTRYSKPKGYETVRFPKCGLVSNDEVKRNTELWNNQYAEQATYTKILSGNVANWLTGSIKLDKTKVKRIPDTTSVYARYQDCLKAPNYTVFSNTTSQTAWRADYKDGAVSLENPHNAIHLAVGGFYQVGEYLANEDAYLNANGDMGDNETASFDPIFYFHHCFIDYVFWTWQKKHGQTKRGSLEVLDDYPGTITDSGSPAGIAPGTVLDMYSPLIPYRATPSGPYLTSHDVTDIIELGYDYDFGSLDPRIDLPQSAPLYGWTPADVEQANDSVTSWKRTFGVNRADIIGSFVLQTFAKYQDTEIEIGREAVLSRFNVRGCANCQQHLDATSINPLYDEVVKALGAPDPKDVTFVVKVLRSNDNKPKAIKTGTMLEGAPASFARPDKSLQNGAPGSQLIGYVEDI